MNEVNRAGWYVTWSKAHYFHAGGKVSICMDFMPIREWTAPAMNGDKPCKDCVKRHYPGRIKDGTGHK